MSINIREAWYKTNEYTSLFSYPKVYKYLRDSKQREFVLTSEQKKEIDAFWNKYNFHIPYAWHRLYYGITGIYDPAFVPNNIFHYGIKYHLNRKPFASTWSDKCYLDRFINNVTTPQCIVRNVNGRFLDRNFELIDTDLAQKTMNNYEYLVIKPSLLTDTGKGVRLLKCPFNLTKLNQEYKKNYVIQIPIKQHEQMKMLNPSSVNTIRINSALFDTKAVVLSAFVKVGQMGAFADNSGHDRYFIGITESGLYKNYVIDHELNKYGTIPSGYSFSGQAVPSFLEACETVKEAHKNIPHFGLAFWDVCIREDGVPMIVEVNLRNPDSYVPQAAVGPFLGKYTERVLDYMKQRCTTY